FTEKTVRISAQVNGAYGNSYTCEVEIDRNESEVLDSNCDCPHTSDCLHLACLLFHLEEHFDALVLQYFEGRNKSKSAAKSSPNNAEPTADSDALKKVLKQAEKKAKEKKEKEREKQDIQDYQVSCSLLGRSAFFVPEEEFHKEQADISFLFMPVG